MAKAGRKSTPIDKAVATANDELMRKLKVELDGQLKQLAQSKWFRDSRERWAAAQAKEAEVARASKRIDRAIAISDGRIAPAWASKLLAQLMPAVSPDHTLDGFVSSKVWVSDEVGRMKAAGNIPLALQKPPWPRISSGA
jgi:hypothetical protein